VTDQEIRSLEGVYGADFLIPKPPAAHQCRLLNFSPIDALTDPAAARGMNLIRTATRRRRLSHDPRRRGAR